MNKSLTTYRPGQWMPYLVLCVLLLSVGNAHSQNCDFVVGPVTLAATGGNNTPDYETSYVLTDPNGDIIDIQSQPRFILGRDGFFVAYSVNGRIGDQVEGLSIGSNILNVSGSCIDISSGFSFTACNLSEICDYCLGESISLTSSGGSTEPDFVTSYILADMQGIILVIQDNPNFGQLDEGLFVAFAINYDPSKTLTGLEVGQNVKDIRGLCYDISTGHIIGVCDDINPRIAFDLNSCNITETAFLQVTGFYDSYLWSTGSTSDFIIVSATDPAIYTVTVTLDGQCIGVTSQEITGEETGLVGDYVWEDTNVNGIQDANESGLNGVTVRLYTDFDRDGERDFPDFPACIFVTTDHPDTGLPGYYFFNVYRANYIIEFVSNPGFTPTTRDQGNDNVDSDVNPATGLTQSFRIVDGETRLNIDAGFVASTGVSGLVWNDVDGDGRRDDSEVGINDLSVNLYSSDGMLIATTLTINDPVTGEPGYYCFDDVPVRDYYVEVVAPDGFTFGPPNAIADDSKDSEITGAQGFGTSDIFPTTVGVKTSEIDASVYEGGAICGIAFQDIEGGTESVYDPGSDTLLQGVFVQLIDDATGRVINFTATDAMGAYCFDAIPVGSYLVMFGASGSLSPVTPNIGGDELRDSDVDPFTQRTDVIFVAPIDTIFGVNVGQRMGVVPIVLASFSGYWDHVDDINVLNWVTSSEINNEYFEIQRTFEKGSSFVSLGRIEGAGTSTSERSYSFNDENIGLNGLYYYRLKQIDYDGGFDYSDIIVIDVNRFKSATSQVYPNPAKDVINVDMNIAHDGEIKASLYDINGKKVRSWPAQKRGPGSQLLSLDTRHLPDGTYLLSVVGPGEKIDQIVQIIN